MSFNASEYKVVHTESRNSNCIYTAWMESHSKARRKKHTSSAIPVLGFIARNLDRKTSKVMLSSFKPLVRPHLGCAALFWSVSYKKNTELVKRAPVKHRSGSISEAQPCSDCSDSP